MQNHIGKQIHDMRKHNGMSQAELAKKLFVKQSSVSRWERGETVPDANSLHLMSELFQVSMDEFYPHSSLSEDASISPASDENIEITDNFGEASVFSNIRKKGKILLAFSILTNLVLITILIIQNTIYIPPEYSMTDSRIVFDNYHRQEVYEYSYVYWLWLSPKKKHEIATTNSIIWHTSPPKEGINILKISFYNSRAKATSWEEPNSVMYIYKGR